MTASALHALLLASVTGLSGVSGGVVVTGELDGEVVFVETLPRQDRPLSIQEVASARTDGAWVPLDSPAFNGGIHPYERWVRLRVDDRRDDPTAVILEVLANRLEVLDVYEELPDGGFRVERAGRARPTDAEATVPPAFVFRLAPSNTPRTVYLRGQGGFGVHMEIWAWTPAAFEQHRVVRVLWVGAFVGILCIMAIYNAMLFVSLRDRSYLYYALFVAGTIQLAVVLHGLDALLLGTASAGRFRLLLSSGVGVTLASALAMTRNFLGTPTNAPKADRALRWAIGLIGAATVVKLIWPSTRYVLLLALAGTFVLQLTAGFSAIRRGFRPARYFTLGWSALALAGIATALHQSGAVPLGNLGNLLMTSEIALLTLLSFALADRIRDIDEQRRQAQEQVTATLARYSEELEERVRARTDELESARALAESANDAKSAFLTHMSHELRTPLNAILGYSQLMLEPSSALPDPERDRIDVIHSSGQHLLGLINDVLDLAKVDAGKLELNPGPVNVRALVSGAVDFIRTRAVDREVTVVVDVAAAVPEVVEVDELRLRQVLLNLLDNAVKYATARVEIRVRATPGPGDTSALRVDVSDDGAGIEPGQLEQIFQPFTQMGDAGQRSGGSGLGLPISRRLVGVMGGRLDASSELQGGSRFGFVVMVPVIRSEGDIPRDDTPIEAVESQPAPLPIGPGAADLELLEELTRLGNLPGVEELVARLVDEDPELAAFGRRVRRFTDGFDDEGLTRLLRRYRDGSRDPVAES